MQSALAVDFHADNTTSATEGLHLGAMAATLDVLQRHYLGTSTGRGELIVAPAPPPELPPVSMRLSYRSWIATLRWDGTRVQVCANPENGSAVPVQYAGRVHHLQPGETRVVWS